MYNSPKKKLCFDCFFSVMFWGDVGRAFGTLLDFCWADCFATCLGPFFGGFGDVFGKCSGRFLKVKTNNKKTM